MPIPQELHPTRPARVMDLVAAAGLDTSDWGNYAKGPKYAAANPRYCYNWAFIEPKKQVLLFLWYDELRDVGGQIVQQLNYRQYAAALPQAAARGAWAKRSLEMDFACALAYQQALPVRVVIVAGKMGNVVVNPKNSSTVNVRLLDLVSWSVTSYDENTGGCTVTRGSPPVAVTDQFDAATRDECPTYRTVTGEVRIRDAAVRFNVLARAKGYCELCGQPGFLTGSGAAYLETHHIVSLSEDGPDTVQNVIALCPNDHRRAHHGQERVSIRDRLKSLVASKLGLA